MGAGGQSRRVSLMTASVVRAVTAVGLGTHPPRVRADGVKREDPPPRPGVVAVVSCPASTSVTRSSRISLSDSRSPSPVCARRQTCRMIPRHGRGRHGGRRSAAEQVVDAPVDPVEPSPEPQRAKVAARISFTGVSSDIAPAPEVRRTVRRCAGDLAGSVTPNMIRRSRRGDSSRRPPASSSVVRSATVPSLAQVASSMIGT